MSYPVKYPVATKEPILTVTNRMFTLLTVLLRHRLTLFRIPPAKPSLWVIELHNGEDNRLTANVLNQALKPALDVVERHWREQWRAAQKVKGKEGAKGALIIVGKQSQDKFFSNGTLTVNCCRRYQLNLW